MTRFSFSFCFWRMKTRRSFGVSPSPNSELVAAGARRTQVRSSVRSGKLTALGLGRDRHRAAPESAWLGSLPCLNRDPAFGACAPPFLQWRNSPSSCKWPRRNWSLLLIMWHTLYQFPENSSFDYFGNEFVVFITEFRASFHCSQPKTLYPTGSRSQIQEDVLG